jgi:hypothetical protein
VFSLRRIEGLLEQLFEGAVGRLFRSPIQPAEIAKKLERAMADNYVVATDGVIVPNVYDVLLHPQDLVQLTAAQATLASQMEQWLREFAREERYRFVGPLRVRLASEVGIARRSLQVRASIVDDNDEATVEPSEVYTRDYQVVRTATGTPACRLKVLNGPRAGHVFIIGGKLTAIGRGLDNDLVLPAADVSRHHARLEQAGSSYRLVDLGSTNGTRVNGRRTGEQLLAPGDTVTLGATELVFQLGEQS